MAKELNCLKDLSAVSITATELCAIDRIISGYIRNQVFQQTYNDLLEDIIRTYGVVLDNLNPFVTITTEQLFADDFDQYYQHYMSCYLKEISKPRVNAECTYEKYLQFRKLKEVNTGFPLLKHSFIRLHDFIDKWLDNDIWLAMYIDSLFKMLARLLNDVNDMKKRDLEDAFMMYQSGLLSFTPYLEIISTSLKLIASRRQSEQ